MFDLSRHASTAKTKDITEAIVLVVCSLFHVPSKFIRSLEISSAEEAGKLAFARASFKGTFPNTVTPITPAIYTNVAINKNLKRNETG